MSLSFRSTLSGWLSPAGCSRGKWLALLALPLLAGVAQAEPLGFKGYLLGSTFLQDARYDCRALTTPLGDSICALRGHERETVAGAPARSVFRYYAGGRLSGIVIHFEEKHFQTVVQALVGKYGQATLRTEILKNLEGKAFENRLYTWRQPEGSLVAQRYSGRLDQSSLRFTDDQAIRALNQQRAGRDRNPQRDL